MEINFYIDRYKNVRYNFFKWRYETNLIYTADGYNGIRVYQSEILDKKNWRHRIREHVCEGN